MRSSICTFFIVTFWVFSTSEAKEDYGEILFLSPYLDAGKIEEAQNLSRVSPDIGNLTSYSGFLTVDKKCESFLFFWFIPAQEGDWKSAPVVFWQQGGPGTTSLFGLFLEIGPLEYSKDAGLTKRKFSWNEKNNLLIIDNPPGVGYSFTRKNCYPKFVDGVGKLLFSGLAEFYRLFPELRGNKLILSGESYAGKYIPVLAHKVHQNNLSKEEKINLTALLLSGSYSDPLTQTPESDLFYQLGMIDDDQKEQYVWYENLCLASIKAQNWKKAADYCNCITGLFFSMFAGREMNIYNFDRGTEFDEESYTDFFELPSTRKALHVGKLLFDPNSAKVQRIMKYDMYQSVKPYVEELLPFYPFIFLNGQHDAICPYVSARKFLRSLKWSNQTLYDDAIRSQWCSQEDLLYGYFKGKHNLYDILVRNCGHYVPREQPEVGQIVINSVCSGSPLDPLEGIFDCDNLG